MRSFFGAITIAGLFLLSHAYDKTIYARTDDAKLACAGVAQGQTAFAQAAYTHAVAAQAGNPNPRTITLRAPAISLIDAFDSIHQQQPTIKFNYCPAEVQYTIHLNLHNALIEAAMDSCLTGLPLDYTRDDYRGRTNVTYITIKRKQRDPIVPGRELLKDTNAVLSAMGLQYGVEFDGPEQTRPYVNGQINLTIDKLCRQDKSPRDIK